MMITSQIVGSGENCDQNGDRVSKNEKSCHICSMRWKRKLTRGDYCKVYCSQFHFILQSVMNLHLNASSFMHEKNILLRKI